MHAAGIPLGTSLAARILIWIRIFDLSAVMEETGSRGPNGDLEFFDPLSRCLWYAWTAWIFP